MKVPLARLREMDLVRNQVGIFGEMAVREGVSLSWSLR